MRTTFTLLSLILIISLSFFTACDSGGAGSSDSSTTISIASISGVTAPVIGETPVSAITETAQYTGTVTWDGGWGWSSYFGGNKAYTATITLTAKSGFTLSGVSTDYFSVTGATSVNNSANSGVITAVFPATATVAIGDSACGGIVTYILESGDTGYVTGEQRGLVAAAADQSSGIIWAISAYQSTSVPAGTDTAQGTGSDNTTNIIDQNGAGTTYAAGIALACTDGSYDDWFLPSWDELTTFFDYDAVSPLSSLNLSGSPYWSSSEFSATAAKALNPGNGNAHNDGKTTTWLVRSVRYF